MDTEFAKLRDALRTVVIPSYTQGASFGSVFTSGLHRTVPPSVIAMVFLPTFTPIAAVDLMLLR